MDEATQSRRDVLRASAAGIAGTSLLSRTDAVVAETQDDDDSDNWSQFGYDAANTGYAPDITGPTSDVTKAWQFQTNNQELTNPPSPVVTDDTVYLGSDDTNLYALSADDGSTHRRNI